MIAIGYAALLTVAWAAPTLLSLSPSTYGITSYAHFVTFFVSVVLFVLMGRSLAQRGRKRFLPGLSVGVIVAIAGTTASQLLMHTPQATNALMAHLPNVPLGAIKTMLTIHAVASAILAAAIFAMLFGPLGGIAAWWGGRTLWHAPNPP